ncbi:MAG: polysaccharide biosynthesis/export family protein [Kangiellaceae bacterium]|nr:polysaccharide biosynthesis/export family protein [Kangiellaceae bacterium]
MNSQIDYGNPKIQPNDILKIDVGALIPETAIPYNKRNNNVGGINVELLQLEGYLVSDKLTIIFPVLGELSVANLDTQQFADFLREKLEFEGHLKDPTVNVRLINAKVTILGEVNQPGTFNFTEQNITLLQALGYAGDLTINGKREDILLIRDNDGKRQITHIDLTTSDWMDGDFNFIKPNDVIVVNQNPPRVTSSGYIGNIGTLLAVASIVLTSVVLITR